MACDFRACEGRERGGPGPQTRHKIGDETVVAKRAGLKKGVGKTVSKGGRINQSERTSLENDVPLVRESCESVFLIDIKLLDLIFFFFFLLIFSTISLWK